MWLQADLILCFFFQDNIYDADSTTQEIYEQVARPIVEESVKGFNGTIFAYGQTSSGKIFILIFTCSVQCVLYWLFQAIRWFMPWVLMHFIVFFTGKTHTMLGDHQNPGIIRLAAREIFELMHKSDRTFLIQ